ncbi:MAG: hypothetical protein HS113_01325 [Verrucomicrobiales bacterium]|nr:hypothetical protein [Verrucomicrobiales bacterium]
MSIRTVKWRGLGRSVCAAVVATGVAATETSEPSANPAFVTIAEQQVPVYPATLPGEVRFPSPGSTREGQEYVVVRTAAGSNAVVLVTVENGDLNLRYGAEKIGKGHQLRVDGEDFPALAANGLHAAAELARTRSITGKPVAEITRLGRPGRASGIGFLAADEDIVSVLLGDNDQVGRLGLKHRTWPAPCSMSGTCCCESTSSASWDGSRTTSGASGITEGRFTSGRSGPRVSRNPSSTTRSRGRLTSNSGGNWRQASGKFWTRPTRT